MIFVLLAALGIALSTLLAWAYPRRAAALCALDGRAWQRELEGLPSSERIARLRRVAAARTWEAGLGAELAAARDDRARALAFNEALTTAEHELAARKTWPRAALWLALASTGICAIAAFLSGVRQELLFLVPLAMLAVASCLQAARSGNRRAARQRANIDALVAAVAGEIAHRDIELPERRQMRWRKRR